MDKWKDPFRSMRTEDLTTILSQGESRMSTTCWWFIGHDWGKWELVVYEVAVTSWRGDSIENWQRRRCKKCGKYQEQFVS